MSVEKINPVYQLNEKTDGSTLSSSEWNDISGAVNTTQTKLNEVIDVVNAGGGGGGTDSHVYMNNKGNLNLETTEADLVGGKGAKINIEPYSDLQIKPGDDITLYSHHRAEGKQDEVAVKVLDGDDIPVKLQLNAAEMTLTTKDKTGDNANVFDVNVNSGKNQKGYLKVRAQAIDLRCEEHGGIAVQPKGKDSQQHENKVKFEHGGGDGLEFGTFNTEKTSIFTDEYRFNKAGVWKMATRTKLDNTPGQSGNGKYDGVDETTHYSYEKQADDFYDEISLQDVTSTTEQIITASNAIAADNRSISWDGDSGLIFDQRPYWEVSIEQNPPAGIETVVLSEGEIHESGRYTDAELIGMSSDFNSLISYEDVGESGVTPVYKFQSFYASISDVAYRFTLLNTDTIIETGGKLEMNAPKGVSLPGTNLDFNGAFAFGETSGGILFQKKYTKKGNLKECDTLRIYAINNHATNSYSFNSCYDSETGYADESSVTLNAGETAIIAEASLYDIIKLVGYMKTNNQGPWASQL